MQSKLLLVNAITLLYRESQLSNKHENSATLVREVIESIKLPEVALGFDSEREILDNLRTTAVYMCETPPDHAYESGELLQRLKVNTLHDDNLYNAFVEGILPTLDEPTIKRTCLNIKRSINSHFRELKVTEIINAASTTLNFSRTKVKDFKAFVSELSSKLEPYMVDVVNKDPAVIGEVNTNNTADVAKIFSGVRNDSEGGTVFKTGFQGINRMLNGGFRRGYTATIGALPHMFKTGFSLTLFKQFALYNTPVLKDPTKKPLLLRISAEDDLKLNFAFLYKSLKENETKQPVSIAGISDEEIAEYVKAKLSVNGFETMFMHVNPSLWTYRDICNKIISLEADGFEVQLVMMDYLIKVPTTGCDQGIAGSDVLNMYERIRNFMAQRDICFVTPHQLSVDAKKMIREGRAEFVKELPGRGFYMKSSQIDQVVDLELFIHIERLNGRYYLTVQRGKHRGILTSDEFLYCILPFLDKKVFECGIFDDVNGPDSTSIKLGGGAVGSGEETPWWENEA